MWDQSVGMVGFLVKALILLWAPSVVQCKESACNVGDTGLIPGSGWSPEREHDNPLQYSCSENHMDRGAWQATVQRIGKSQTQLKWLSMHTHSSWSTESCILTYERQTDKELSWSLLISALTYSWGFYSHDLITSQRHACMLSHFSCVRLFVTPWTIVSKLLLPWDSPGRNTGVGCHSLLLGIFLTGGSNLCSLTYLALTGGFFTTSNHSPHPNTITFGS